MFKVAKELVLGNMLEMSAIERLINPGKEEEEYQGECEYGTVIGVRKRLFSPAVEVTVDYIGNDDMFALPEDMVVEVSDDPDIEPYWVRDLDPEVKRACDLEFGDVIDVGPILDLIKGEIQGTSICRVGEPSLDLIDYRGPSVTNWNPRITLDPVLVLVSGVLDGDRVIDLWVHDMQAFKLIEGK